MLDLIISQLYGERLPTLVIISSYTNTYSYVCICLYKLSILSYQVYNYLLFVLAYKLSAAAWMLTSNMSHIAAPADGDPQGQRGEQKMGDLIQEVTRGCGVCRERILGIHWQAVSAV